MKLSFTHADASRKKTKVDHIYEYLLQLIREMRLPPGTHLQKDEIAAQLGVSRAPVSEAITRLEEQMLVDVFPHHGSFVSPIRPKDLRESHFIRAALEMEAARQVAMIADAVIIQQLEDSLTQQDLALNNDDLKHFYELDELFHRIFFEALDYSRAAYLRMTARTPMDRPMYGILSVPDRAQTTFAEHSRIVDAVKQKDAEYAGAAMRSHLSMTGRIMENELIRFDKGTQRKM